MVGIKWCMEQNKGIKVVEPNDNLAQEYLWTAEETLLVLKGIETKSRVWLATTKYYCEYFSVYALLMKLGIKCEIHECTIELCAFLESQSILPKGYANKLRIDKDIRIENQYYLKNKDVEVDYDSLAEFVLKIKDIILKLDDEKINRIRDMVKKI